MRLFPIRMTTRRWMVAVAIVGISLGTILWHVKWIRAYRWMAAENARRKSNRTIAGPPGKAPIRINALGEVVSPERDRWYAAMAAKYSRADLCP
jgi:hypothetical protein